MVFKCQEDSFLKEFVSKIVACEKAQFKDNGTDIDGYNVICEDTILFPEGGGQPCDHGFLNNHRVLNVTRKGDEAVHFVKSVIPLIIGEEVKQTIDWNRRKDHMQQHSGQHLITAIFEREYKYYTKSWWLGSETSYIELDAKNVTQTEMDNVEKIVNELIANGNKVSVQNFNKDDSLSEEVTRATRGLPDDHVGPVRVVTIEGVEGNMCCGTHVSSLAQLQVIKMLNVEKVKNKILVHFLVGDRVIHKLGVSFNRELKLNQLLNGGPSNHIDLVTKLQQNIKKMQRTLKNVCKEIAIQEAQKLKMNSPKPKFFFLHRNDGADSDFVTTFLRELNSEEIFLFITIGDDTGKGQLILQGDAETIAKLGPEICKLLDGKGNGKNTKFQAKINNLKNITQCENVITSYFETKLN